MAAYLIATAISVISLVLGGAICGRAGRWSWTAPAVGLAAAMLIAATAIRLPGHGGTAAAALAISGCGLVGPHREGEGRRSGSVHRRPDRRGRAGAVLTSVSRQRPDLRAGRKRPRRPFVPPHSGRGDEDARVRRRRNQLRLPDRAARFGGGVLGRHGCRRFGSLHRPASRDSAAHGSDGAGSTPRCAAGPPGSGRRYRWGPLPRSFLFRRGSLQGAVARALLPRLRPDPA